MTTSAAFGQLCQPSAGNDSLEIPTHSSCHRARCVSGGETVHSNCQIKGKSKQCMVGWSKCQWGPVRLHRFLLSRNTSYWSEDAGTWGAQTSLQINAFHQHYRRMAGEEMEMIRLFLCIIYHMRGSDMMLLRFPLNHTHTLSTYCLLSSAKLFGLQTTVIYELLWVSCLSISSCSGINIQINPDLTPHLIPHFANPNGVQLEGD